MSQPRENSADVSAARRVQRLREARGVSQFRVIQKRPDLLLIQLQLKDDSAQQSWPELERSLTAAFDGKMALEHEIVPSFDPLGTKFKAFVSELS